MALTQSERRKRYYETHKASVLAYNSEYRKKHRKKFSEYSAAWREKNRDRWLKSHKEHQKKYIVQNNDVAYAHSKVRNAIMLGTLVPQPCEVCGEKLAEAHHDDYNKPLEVRWLCKKHHSEWHILNKPIKRKEN